MDKRLRLLILATALALAPQAGYGGPFATLFAIMAVFFIPTSVTLTAAILYTIRTSWREHPGFILLSVLNLVLAATAVWHFIRL